MLAIQPASPARRRKSRALGKKRTTRIATMTTAASTSRMVKPARRARMPEACTSGFAKSGRSRDRACYWAVVVVVVVVWLPTFVPLREKVYATPEGLPLTLVSSVPVLLPEKVMIDFFPVRFAVKAPPQVFACVKVS